MNIQRIGIKWGDQMGGQVKILAISPTYYIVRSYREKRDLGKRN